VSYFAFWTLLAAAIVSICSINNPVAFFDDHCLGFFRAGNLHSFLWNPAITKSGLAGHSKDILILHRAEEVSLRISSVYISQNIIFDATKIYESLKRDGSLVNDLRNKNDGQHPLAADRRMFLGAGLNENNCVAVNIESLRGTVLGDCDSQRPVDIRKARLSLVKISVLGPVANINEQSSPVLIPLRFGSSSSFNGLPDNGSEGAQDGPYRESIRPCYEYVPPRHVFLSILALVIAGFIFCIPHKDWSTALIAYALIFDAGLLLLVGHKYYCPGDNPRSEQYSRPSSQHNSISVPRKYLTGNSYWGTVIDMANVLNTDKQIAVIGALTEGSSIRSIERMTGIHRDTIMRLGVKVGEGCAKLMDTAMRDLPCNRLELDEIWGFVGKKERNVREGEDGVGSVWTFCAIDAETKLVPAFKVGNRDVATATEFVKDVADRMAYRVQISTDGLSAYVTAMQNAFGEFVDYAQIIKTYGHEEVSDNRRYSAPKFVSSEKKIIVGNPDERLISTSYVERLNATTRLHMRRLTRLTLAFSKKRENFDAAVALHFAYYNFVKRHNTLRCTPAMAAGVTGTFWSVGDLVEAAA
jgi:IS1 family transposase